MTIARPVALLRLEAIQRVEDLEDEIDRGVTLERWREVAAVLDRWSGFFRARDARTAAVLEALTKASARPRAGSTDPAAASGQGGGRSSNHGPARDLHGGVRK